MIEGGKANADNRGIFFLDAGDNLLVEIFTERGFGIQGLENLPRGVVGKPGEYKTQLRIPFAAETGGNAIHFVFRLEIGFVHTFQTVFSAGGLESGDRQSGDDPVGKLKIEIARPGGNTPRFQKTLKERQRQMGATGGQCPTGGEEEVDSGHARVFPGFLRCSWSPREVRK